MNILHTSDWHIGHKLYGRQRHHEHSDFLDWLLGCINKEHVDVLIVAGDIFNSQTPSNQSLTIYYKFLSCIVASHCSHIIIIGGNHDSPTLLNAPRELLSFLNIHVIGKVPDNIEDELITLSNKHGEPELLVLAVPYLRDKDIRLSVAKESPAEKSNRMTQGIQDHYIKLSELATQRQRLLKRKIPIIATGHLFCQGGKTRQGDGVRELYVGQLVKVGLDTFPPNIDYLALGHLHMPQKISKQANRRYSGAPLAMSFTEAQEQKCVLVIDTEKECSVREIPIPCFQALQSINGDMDAILETLEDLAKQDKSILLEINYQGQYLIDDLQEQIYSAIENTLLEVLRISNKRIYDHILQRSATIKTLEELTPHQVFLQCLDLNEIPDEQRQELELGFVTALTALQTEE